jgi:hypothetical protein
MTYTTSDVHVVEGYKLRPHCGPLTKGHVYVSLGESFYLLPSEAYQRVMCLLQVLLYETHVEEALSSDNIRRAAIVH